MSWTQFWDNVTTPGFVRETAREFGEITEDLRKELAQILNKEGREVVEGLPGAIEEMVEVFTAGNLDPVNDSVPAPEPGGVVYCRMRGVIARSGVCLGDGRVAFLDEFGDVEAEEPRRFVMDLNTCKHPRSIFVACAGLSPLGLKEAAERAQALVDAHSTEAGAPSLTNAHQFTIGCLTGDFSQGGASLEDAKRAAREWLGADCWRRWDLGDALEI